MEVKSLVQFKKSESQILHKNIPPSSHKSSQMSTEKPISCCQTAIRIFTNSNLNSSAVTVNWSRVRFGRFGTDLNLFSLLLQRLHRSIWPRSGILRGDSEDCLLKPTGKKDTFTTCKEERIRFSCFTYTHSNGLTLPFDLMLPYLSTYCWNNMPVCKFLGHICAIYITD